MDFEKIALDAINARIDELVEGKPFRRTFPMKQDWAVKEAEKIVKGRDAVMETAKKIMSASNKYLKIVYYDKLYHFEIRQPVVNRRLKQAKKEANNY